MFNLKRPKIEIVDTKMYKATDGSLHQHEFDAFYKNVRLLFKKYEGSDGYGSVSYTKIVRDWASFVKGVNRLNAD